MGPDNDALWRQAEQLLRRRPGWVVLASPTPGTPAYWCFARGSEIEVLVIVADGSITLQLTNSDEIVPLENVSDLVTWLTAHRPGSLQEPKRSVFERLKSGQLFRWQ